MTDDRIVNDCFPSLPNGYDKGSRAFRPYGPDARRWLGRLRDNASVISLGLAIALAVA